MFDIGLPEMVVIGVVMLIVLGPEKLPDTFRTIGRVVRQLREASSQLTSEFQRAMDEGMREETPTYTPYTSSTPSATTDDAPSLWGAGSADATPTPDTAATAEATAATEAQAEETREARARTGEAEGEPPWQEMKLLVVAADPAMSESVVALLESWGTTFSVAFDVEAALQVLQSLEPHAVLLDAQFAPAGVARLASLLQDQSSGPATQVVWLGEPPPESPIPADARTVALPVTQEALRVALAEVAATAKDAAGEAESVAEVDHVNATELMSGPVEAEPAPQSEELQALPPDQEPAPAVAQREKGETDKETDQVGGNGVERAPREAPAPGETKVLADGTAEPRPPLERGDGSSPERRDSAEVVSLYRAGRADLESGARLLGLAPREFATLLEKQGIRVPDGSEVKASRP